MDNQYKPKGLQQTGHREELAPGASSVQSSQRVAELEKKIRILMAQHERVTSSPPKNRQAEDPAQQGNGGCPHGDL